MSDEVKLHQAQGTPMSRASVESIRARETERVLRKFDLAPEQAEAVERVSRSLVDNLLHGPIAKVTANIERMSEQQAAGKHNMLEETEVSSSTSRGSSRRLAGGLWACTRSARR
jgi:glutamyl-tRNA reductase